MARAMGNVIIELDIAMTAGETAILGEPKKVKALNSLCEEMEIQIEQLLTKTNAHAQGMVDFEEKLINAGVK